MAAYFLHTVFYVLGMVYWSAAGVLRAVFPYLAATLLALPLGLSLAIASRIRRRYGGDPATRTLWITFTLIVGIVASIALIIVLFVL